jgi:phosphoserine phosphatase RsbU/P
MDKVILNDSLALIQGACVIVIAAYIVTRSSYFTEIMDGRFTWKNRMVSILFFGGLSVYGSLMMVDVSGAILNVRDLGPMVGGLIFGPVVGLGAGLIGATFRLSQGGFTAIPCSLATALAGLFGGLIYLKKGKAPGILFSVAFAVLFEFFHMALALAIARPFHIVLGVAEEVVGPMALANGVGMLLFTYIVANMRDEKRTILQRDRFQVELENKNAELAVAAEIQRSFIPDSIPSIIGFDMAATTLPAKEVGGDFYDFIPGKDCLGIVIADVSGKGIPAALFMALSRTVIQSKAVPGKSAGEVLRDANDVIKANSASGMFVTLFLGFLNYNTREMIYANAGHYPPLLLRSKGNVLEALDVTGIALGLAKDMNYEEHRVKLDPGDVLVLYTDGIIDARNGEDIEFGLERLKQSVIAQPLASANVIIGEIVKEISKFSENQEQFDDVTAIVLKVEG